MTRPMDQKTVNRPAPLSQTSHRNVNENAYRVMVVDDSAIIRGLLTKALETDRDIEVVASVGNGKIAVDTLQRKSVDVIVLDIEMPVMDGLTALPLLLKIDPKVKIIMASTLTLRNADISMQAMQAGAADYVAKPSSRGLTNADEFKRELTEKVKVFGQIARGGGSRGMATGLRDRTKPASPASPQKNDAPVSARSAQRPAFTAATKQITLQKENLLFSPDVVAIGSSTGGPQALFKVIPHLKNCHKPVVITQHMPATFTTILADHIKRECGVECREAKDGDKLEQNVFLVAPGDYHMLFEKKADGVFVKLTQDPPENFCRPAVDPMLRSLVDCFGGKVLSVILTGMGQDGLVGAEKVVSAGGVILAQDKETSVVWGMPGAVSQAGICTKVLPLTEIGPHLKRVYMRTAA